MKASVGPTAENLAYGDAVAPLLQPQQFHALPVKTSVPSENGWDNGSSQGWYGPMGIFSEPTSSGSMYGFGVSSGVPQY